MTGREAQDSAPRTSDFQHQSREKGQSVHPLKTHFKVNRSDEDAANRRRMRRELPRGCLLFLGGGLNGIQEPRTEEHGKTINPKMEEF